MPPPGLGGSDTPYPVFGHLISILSDILRHCEDTYLEGSMTPASVFAFVFMLHVGVWYVSTLYLSASGVCLNCGGDAEADFKMRRSML